jgi:hypothetical protein
MRKKKGSGGLYVENLVETVECQGINTCRGCGKRGFSMENTPILLIENNLQQLRSLARQRFWEIYTGQGGR